MLYLITYSYGQSCATFTSLASARREAANSGPQILDRARYFTRAPDGDLYGYATRADLYRDRHDGSQAVAIIRPISDPSRYVRDEDLPYRWRRSVALAAGIEGI